MGKKLTSYKDIAMQWFYGKDAMITHNAIDGSVYTKTLSVEYATRALKYDKNQLREYTRPAAIELVIDTSNNPKHSAEWRIAVAILEYKKMLGYDIPDWQQLASFAQTSTKAASYADLRKSRGIPEPKEL